LRRSWSRTRSCRASTRCTVITGTQSASNTSLTSTSRKYGQVERRSRYLVKHVMRLNSLTAKGGMYAAEPAIFQITRYNWLSPKEPECYVASSSSSHS
jgi:hypothetical protein